jgi:hypothetical protein
VPLAVFDRTIDVLRRAVSRARLGSTEALAAIRRLDAQARRLEALATEPTFDAFIAAERRQSGNRGERTVK